MIKHIKFISVRCATSSARWSSGTNEVGFTVKTDAPMGPGQRWIELAIPGDDTGLVLFTPPGHEDRIGGFVPMSFATADVQKTYEEMRGKGVEFSQPPKTEPWGTSAIFQDPDGNSFVLGSET